jgi:hypothetical protein
MRLGLLHEVPRPYSDTPHSVGLLRTSDQAIREPYLISHNTHKIQTSMTSVGFEPTIPASEWPKTHTMDRVVTGIGN